jgi:hypothetical protein
MQPDDASPRPQYQTLVLVGFVVDEVTLGQVFLRVLRFSLVSIISSWRFMLIYQLGDEQQAC